MSGFDDAVRALARREGFDVADDEPVYSGMDGGTQWLSEVTGEAWGEVELACGKFNRTYTDVEILWKDLIGP